MYENAKVSKVRTKAFHDKRIVQKHFEPNQKVFLFDSRLHVFPRKLKSRWTGPYIVQRVYPHGAIDVEGPKDGNMFKVNEQRLKPFLEGFDPLLESIPLVDPVYEVH